MADTAHDLCIVQAGTGCFGLEAAYVREVLTGDCVPLPLPLGERWVQGLVPYSGQILLAVSLRQLLGMEPCEQARTGVVIQPGGKECFVLLVDAVEGVVSVKETERERLPQGADEDRTLFRSLYQTGGRLVVRLEEAGLMLERLSIRICGRRIDAGVSNDVKKEGDRCVL